MLTFNKENPIHRIKSYLGSGSKSKWYGSETLREIVRKLKKTCVKNYQNITHYVTPTEIKQSKLLITGRKLQEKCEIIKKDQKSTLRMGRPGLTGDWFTPCSSCPVILSSGTPALGSESFLSAAFFLITEVGVKARGEEEEPFSWARNPRIFSFSSWKTNTSY